MRKTSLLVLLLIANLSSATTIVASAGEQGKPRRANTNCTFKPEGFQSLTDLEKINSSLNICCSRISLLKEDTQPLLNSGVVCSFVLRKNGEIADLKIDETSGIPALDERALQVVKEASPFTSLLPSEALYKKRVKIVFSQTIKAKQGPSI
ncbi:MAG TPA: energy transducer TonB [Candidatus Obscuribacter sp.]|nr:TonB family protein [Candidatus Obscuribacter sp.]HMY53321.1 energy transducer TonB [Candidatus Obscuribacter sp.]HNB16815.1 energy transducer TonB [Candidatus Obscuribacter sp.]